MWRSVASLVRWAPGPEALMGKLALIKPWPLPSTTSLFQHAGIGHFAPGCHGVNGEGGEAKVPQGRLLEALQLKLLNHVGAKFRL